MRAKNQRDICIENKTVEENQTRRIASELELCVSDTLTVLDFMDLYKNCDRYKSDPDSVHDLANLIIEERKYDESQQLDLEKKEEKSKLDLEITRIRANDKDNNTEVNCNDSSSLDSLIKNPNFTSERVIQPSSLGVQKEPETEESSMSQFSVKASVFKPINYIGEISKEESSSQGVGDLFTATSYVK
ncbi:hypothetical protein TNCV_629561 [Trichonephila clavipes]|nr:hypothetical protein TNCV_629561 [Trichonephila clavipes]